MDLVATYVTPSTDFNVSSTNTTGTYFYTHDGLGSVRQLLDASETIQNDYDYNAFGESVSETELVTNDFKYTGRKFDPESGIYYYRARYYGTAIGRFLQKDPLFANLVKGKSLFAYVADNPASYADPSGLIFSLPGIGIAIGLGGLIGGLYGYYLGGWRGALCGAIAGAGNAFLFALLLPYLGWWSGCVSSALSSLAWEICNTTWNWAAGDEPECGAFNPKDPAWEHLVCTAWRAFISCALGVAAQVSNAAAQVFEATVLEFLQVIVGGVWGLPAPTARAASLAMCKKIGPGAVRGQETGPAIVPL